MFEECQLISRHRFFTFYVTGRMDMSQKFMGGAGQVTGFQNLPTYHSGTLRYNRFWLEMINNNDERF